MIGSTGYSGGQAMVMNALVSCLDMMSAVVLVLTKL